MTIISVEHLKKTYQIAERRGGRFGTLISLFHPAKREITAVSDISFQIERGESVAYLGPNGAGKSTTIKMLTGILEPTSGSISVNGLDPHRHRKQNSYRIGCVFGQRSQLLFDLPVKDSFELLRYMYGIPAGRYRNNVEEYAAVLQIESLFNRPVRTLSLGQRMRCEMMAALLHEPEILFLDEPTIGLDVVAKERIRVFIERMNREKKLTVLLTTHDLTDIERLCPRIIIIDKGKKIYDGGLEYIKERYATQRQIRLMMSDLQAAQRISEELGQIPKLDVTVENLSVKITYDQRSTDTSEILRYILTLGNPRDLIMQDENIEVLVRRIYEEGIQWDGIEGESLIKEGIG